MADAKLQAPILGKTTKVTLDSAVFGEPFNGTLVHEVVRAERNAKRSGNASTKLRGEVAMTGAKAWRQKGTGRARVGALSAGHRRGGGVTFGPKPRDYIFKVNRKARRKALRAALSLHADRGSLAIVETASYDKPSTADAYDSLVDWKENGSVVLITAGDTDVNTTKSFRNIERVRAVLSPAQIGVYEITSAQNLIVSQEALEALTALASTEIDRSSKKPVKAVAVGKRPPNAKFVSGKADGAATGTATSSAEPAGAAAQDARAESDEPTENAAEEATE